MEPAMAKALVAALAGLETDVAPPAGTELATEDPEISHAMRADRLAPAVATPVGGRLA